jgi:RNA polymerase sigma factor (sigma-70 family)
MPTKRLLASSRSFVALFDSGSLGTQSDCDLLECFLTDSGPIGQEAFRILVERHGPMVLGLCRSLVRDQHEAEDAFQATFLVLVRKAASIDRRDTLAPWLYGVAAKVARRARTRLNERRKRETPVSPETPGRDHASPDSSSSERIIHDEISRLPDSFRKPLVLCCIEGLSYDLAARQLGLNHSTLRGRLERARKRLHSRLKRRGLPAFVGVGGPSLPSLRVSLPPLPSTLIETTVQFSLRWSRLTGLLGGGTVVPPSIAALAQGVVQSMFLQTIRVSAAALLAVGAIGTVVVAQQGKGRLTEDAVPAAIAGHAQEESIKPEHESILAYLGQDAIAKPEDRQAPAGPAAKLGKSLRPDPTARIRQKLDMKVGADFPKTASLETLLKTIKKITTDATYSGIPIYVDPAGIKDVKLTMETQIAEIPDQQPIRNILSNSLRPLGLMYDVRDGFLMISSRTAILEHRVEEIDRKLDRVIEMLSRMQQKN